MERRSGVIVFILSMSLLFRFTHEKRLERESPNWGLEPMINGEPTMRWSGKITPFNIPLTNETEDEQKQELNEMLSPANAMLASLQEELRSLKLKCSELARVLREQKAKVHYASLSSESLTKYGYKELNDSQLDRVLSSRLNRTYADVFGAFGSNFTEAAKLGLPLTGLADSLNAQAKDIQHSFRFDTEVSSSLDSALDELRSHAASAKIEGMDSLDLAKNWTSQINASKAVISDTTVELEKCHAQVETMRKSLDEATRSMSQNISSHPCPTFDTMSLMSQSKKDKITRSVFLENMQNNPECTKYLNTDPSELFDALSHGEDHVTKSSYELFQDEVAKMEKSSQDEDEDFPLPPDEDPDMKELPSESCCDPVCLRKILKQKVWAMRRAALIGKHLEVLATKKMANVLMAKWPGKFWKIIRYFIATIIQTRLCKFKSKKGTCKTKTADGFMDYICMYASIEDKHWCNTKNLETVQGAGIHEMVVRRRLNIHAQPLQLNQINASKKQTLEYGDTQKKNTTRTGTCAIALRIFPLPIDGFWGFLFDIFILILTPRFIRIAKRMKDPRTGLPAASPAFLANPVINRQICKPMWDAQKEQAGKMVTSTVQSFKNSFDEFIRTIIDWIKNFFKVPRLIRQRDWLKRQIRPKTPLSNIIDEAVLQSVVEKTKAKQWTWQERKARDCMARRDYENVMSWTTNENITRKYENAMLQTETEARNAQRDAESAQEDMQGMQEHMEKVRKGEIPPKEPFTTKPMVEETDPMPIYTSGYNEMAIKCDNDKAESLNPWDCVYYKMVTYSQSYIDMLDREARQSLIEAQLLYGSMKKASIENSRKVPMRRVRWPWVPPKPICITAKIKGWPKPSVC